jgi:hypothetical protein
MHDWWKKECIKSIDGLPALEVALNKAGTPFQHNWVLTAQVKKKKPVSAPAVTKSTSGIAVQLVALKNPAFWSGSRPFFIGLDLLCFKSSGDTFIGC